MTPDEINAAIALCSGYKKKKCPGGDIEWTGPDFEYIGRFFPDTTPSVIPNYHGSLDAIVPVIRAMPDAERSKVIDALISLNLKRSCQDDFLATPDEWCECYLKSKGLWK